jgi:hypothetical protein
MATTDRRGVSVDATDTAIAGSPNPGLGIKAPCFVGTTGNITLAGLQTIDGQLLAEGNRVLVWQQSDQTQNGIYNASSGAWTRAIDANSNDKFASGLLISTAGGASLANDLFQLTTADPIILGTSQLVFVQRNPVPASRHIDTTAPLAGGGTLGSDLTLSLNAHGITYSFMQQVSANSIIGNPTGSLANAQEISIASGVATFLGTPSSANLRAVLTDESGTGAAVFANGNIGAASGTSLALGGAILGSNTLALTGIVAINGTGQNNSRLLVGNLVPADWPVDAVAVTSELSGQNSVAIAVAPVLTTPPGSNKTAYGFSTQGQIATGQAWDQWEANKLQGLFLNAGATVAKQYGQHIAPMSGATTINQAGWIEGTATTGRWGFGTEKAQAQVVVNANAKTDLALPSGTQAAFVSADGTVSAVTIAGIGGNFCNAQLLGLRIRGTAASPSVVTASDMVFQFLAEGYDSTGTYGIGGRIDFQATSGSNWSSTGHGCDVVLAGTPDASTSTAEVLRARGSRAVSINGAADNGAGSVTTTDGFIPGTFTVGTAPAGVTGKVVYFSDLRVFNGAGTREGAAAGTGGFAIYKGGAWKNLDAQNVTAAA